MVTTTCTQLDNDVSTVGIIRPCFVSFANDCISFCIFCNRKTTYYDLHTMEDQHFTTLSFTYDFNDVMPYAHCTVYTLNHTIVWGTFTASDGTCHIETLEHVWL